MANRNRDVLRWLLEDDNPSVKYWTLRNLLDYNEDDFRVRATRELIMQQGPVPRILAELNAQGHFDDPYTREKYGAPFAAFGYLPKYRATVWQLLLFAELAADGKDPRVQLTAEYVLDHCWQSDGLFSMVGGQFFSPCFQGNMIYSLLRLGYGDDPRVTQALDILLEFTRFDDGGYVTPKGWPYRGKQDRCCGSHSCYAGSLKALKAISVFPREQWDERIRAFVARGAEFFLVHRIYRASHHPLKLLRHDIDKITFPNFVYGDFVEILTTLLVLGIKDDRMQDAIDLLKSKQLPDDCWKLERDVTTMHVPLGRKHHESKWATYRAMYALKLWTSNAPIQDVPMVMVAPAE